MKAGFFYSRFGQYGLFALLLITLFIGTTTKTFAETVNFSGSLDAFVGIATGNNRSVAQQFTLTGPAQTLVLTSRSYQNSGGMSVQAYIYSNSAGSPGSLLYTSDASQGGLGGNCVTGGNQTHTFSSINLTAGTYFIQLVGESGGSNAIILCGQGSGASVPFGLVSPALSGTYSSQASMIYGNLVTTYVPPPPPPLPSCGEDVPTGLGIASSSYGAFTNQTGTSPSDVKCWMTNKLLLPFLGAGLATLYTVRFWFVALIIFSALVYFGLRALGFFKY